MSCTVEDYIITCAVSALILLSPIWKWLFSRITSVCLKFKTNQIKINRPNNFKRFVVNPEEKYFTGSSMTVLTSLTITYWRRSYNRLRDINVRNMRLNDAIWQIIVFFSQFFFFEYSSIQSLYTWKFRSHILYSYQLY